MSEQNRSLDVLGIKPIAESVNTVTKAAVDGAGAFLGRICLPAAEEFGLLLRDKVSAWRTKNAVSVTQKAQALFEKLPHPEKRHAHPRIVGAVVENSSWCDDDAIQSMWAGLLATSCTDDGVDQSNLVFINTLSQLTTSEVKILNYACEAAKKDKSAGGWINVEEELVVPLAKLMEISDQLDVHRLDLELDHLRELGLLWPIAGFRMDSTDALLSPSAFGLQLYVRGQGFIGSPLEYFGL